MKWVWLVVVLVMAGWVAGEEAFDGTTFEWNTLDADGLTEYHINYLAENPATITQLGEDNREAVLNKLRESHANDYRKIMASAELLFDDESILNHAREYINSLSTTDGATWTDEDRDILEKIMKEMDVGREVTEDIDLRRLGGTPQIEIKEDALVIDGVTINKLTGDSITFSFDEEYRRLIITAPNGEVDVDTDTAVFIASANKATINGIFAEGVNSHTGHPPSLAYRRGENAYTTNGYDNINVGNNIIRNEGVGVVYFTAKDHNLKDVRLGKYTNRDYTEEQKEQFSATVITDTESRGKTQVYLRGYNSNVDFEEDSIEAKGRFLISRPAETDIPEGEFARVIHSGTVFGDQRRSTISFENGRINSVQGHDTRVKEKLGDTENTVDLLFGATTVYGEKPERFNQGGLFRHVTYSADGKIHETYTNRGKTGSLIYSDISKTFYLGSGGDYEVESVYIPATDLRKSAVVRDLISFEGVGTEISNTYLGGNPVGLIVNDGKVQSLEPEQIQSKWLSIPDLLMVTTFTNDQDTKEVVVHDADNSGSVSTLKGAETEGQFVLTQFGKQFTEPTQNTAKITSDERSAISHQLKNLNAGTFVISNNNIQAPSPEVETIPITLPESEAQQQHTTTLQGQEFQVGEHIVTAAKPREVGFFANLFYRVIGRGWLWDRENYQGRETPTRVHNAEEMIDNNRVTISPGRSVDGIERFYVTRWQRTPQGPVPRTTTHLRVNNKNYHITWVATDTRTIRITTRHRRGETREVGTNFVAQIASGHNAGKFLTPTGPSDSADYAIPRR